MIEMTELDWERLEASKKIKDLQWEIEKAEYREILYGRFEHVTETTKKVMPKIKKLKAFLNDTREKGSPKY